MIPYPFLVQEDASGRRLKPVGSREKIYDEIWLQELLRNHPDILPVAEVEAVFHPLIPIGREVVTETGVIDNLFISPRGYLVLVETKLWRNPEAKREVIAQAIDYAGSLSRWDYDRLDEVAKRYTSRFEGVEMGLADWVEHRSGPLERGYEFFEDTVIKTLRWGRFLIAIVGDRIRRSLVDMVGYVNRYPHLAANIALIELNCYRWEQESAWPLLVVPKIVARTEIVERSVIQVTVEPKREYKVEVHRERKSKSGKRVSLTEDAFWDLLSKNAPGEYERVKDLLEKYKAKEGVSVEPTGSAMVVRLDIRGTGRQISLFFVDKSGRLRVWPYTIRAQIEKAGLDGELAGPYESELRRVLKMPPERREFARRASEVELDDFVSAVEAFSERIRLAESVA